MGHGYFFGPLSLLAALGLLAPLGCVADADPAEDRATSAEGALTMERLKDGKMLGLDGSMAQQTTADPAGAAGAQGGLGVGKGVDAPSLGWSRSQEIRQGRFGAGLGVNGGPVDIERFQGRIDVTQTQEEGRRLDLDPGIRGRFDVAEAPRGRIDLDQEIRGRFDVAEARRGRIDLGRRIHDRVGLGEAISGRIDVCAGDVDQDGVLPSDAELLVFVGTIHQAEIDLSLLVATMSDDDAVREFADLILEHHRTALQRETHLFQAACIDTESSVLIRRFGGQRDDWMERLQAQDGMNFDLAYIELQIALHQQVLALFTAQLLEKIDNHVLRVELGQMVDDLGTHLTLARTLYDALCEGRHDPGQGTVEIRRMKIQGADDPIE